MVEIKPNQLHGSVDTKPVKPYQKEQTTTQTLITISNYRHTPLPLYVFYNTQQGCTLEALVPLFNKKLTFLSPRNDQK